MSLEAEVPSTTVTIQCNKHNLYLEIEAEHVASGQLAIYVDPCEECIADAIEQGHTH